jgi:glutaminase
MDADKKGEAGKMKNSDYSVIVGNIYNEVKQTEHEGKVADYIPELAKIEPDRFGVCLIDISGKEYSAGDHSERFSIQSISKVFSLAVAFSILGEKLWERVGVEPSGSSFNSIVQLEYEKGKPRNPLINAGALVICDALISLMEDPQGKILRFVQELSSSKDVKYNLKVAESEKEYGFRNAALINMMKSYRNIENAIDSVLDMYYTLCSLEMNCSELARSFLPFCDINSRYEHSGVNLSKSQVKRINALMLCCGFYDESGEFAFEVGLPGKSGVGGGIAAVCPNSYAVATWSPRINSKGNSVYGMRFLEKLTTRTERSIF